MAHQKLAIEDDVGRMRETATDLITGLKQHDAHEVGQLLRRAADYMDNAASVVEAADQGIEEREVRIGELEDRNVELERLFKKITKLAGEGQPGTPS